MSVFKGLNRSDVYLTDYDSKKWWSVPGTNLSELGIKILKGVEKPPYYCSKPEDEHTIYAPVSGTAGVTSSYVTGSYNEGAVFGSIRELYYSSQPEDVPEFRKEYDQFGSASFVPNIRTVLNTASYASDLYLQTTLTIPGARTLPRTTYRDEQSDLPDHQVVKEPAGIIVISIPREVIGSGITPGTFQINLDTDNQCYVEDDYMIDETGSFCDDGYPLGTWTKVDTHWVDPYFEDLRTGPLTDFNGVLIYSGFAGTWHTEEDLPYPTPTKIENMVGGDIVYSHGNIIITDKFLAFLFGRWDAEDYKWQSTWPRFTTHFTCKVRDLDYNYTLNPTAPIELQRTPGFTPYITSVGLYNDRGELLAVAKLSKPVKKPFDTDMTFDLQIDLG